MRMIDVATVLTRDLVSTPKAPLLSHSETATVNVHRANPKHDSRADLLGARHLQPDDRRDRDDEENDVGHDVRDGDAHVQHRLVDASGRDRFHGVPAGADRAAPEEQQAGEDGDVGRHDADGGVDGDLETRVARDLQVEGEEGGLCEAVADDEDCRDDVGGL